MKDNNGFTLIEMLVVVALLAVVLPVSYELLVNTLSNQKHLESVDKELETLTEINDYLTDDLYFLIDRGVRNERGGLESSLVVNKGYLSFTRTSWSNPMMEERSQLQRVEYTSSSSSITRKHQTSLDRVDDNAHNRNFEGASLQEIRVYTNTGEVFDEWPTSHLLSDTPKVFYPVSLELKLSTKKGIINRLFALPLLSPGFTL